MTPPDRDPFEQLRRLPDPEPDPQAMRATTAASREAFTRRVAEKPQEARPGWWARLWGSLGNPAGWLVPAGVGAFGMVAAFAMLPSVLMQPAMQGGALHHPQAPAEIAMEREAPAMAESRDTAEALPAPPAAEADNTVSVSAVPAPAEAPGRADAASGFDIYAEDDLRLGYRLDEGRYTLLMLTEKGARSMDDREVDGDAVTIRDAFRLPRPDGLPEIIAVQTQLGSRPPVWDAYLFDGTSLSRDAVLSTLIADARGAGEAEARLRASGSR